MLDILCLFTVVAFWNVCVQVLVDLFIITFFFSAQLSCFSIPHDEKETKNKNSSYDNYKIYVR